MNQDQALRHIRRVIERSGLSQAAFARQHGFSGEVIGQSLRGKRAPARSILDATGLERVTTYRLKREEPTP